MVPTVRSLIAVVRAMRTEIRQKRVTFLAGSIAYHAFISLLPLLLLAFVFFAAIGNESLQTQVISDADSLSPGIGSLVEAAIEDEQGRVSASVVGVVTLTWGALKVFRGLDTAFSEIYADGTNDSILTQVRDGLVVLVAIGIAVIATVVAGTLLALFPALPFIEVLNPLVLTLALCIVFFPMYYLFPGVAMTPRAVLPGTILAAVGWTALQGLFGIYVQVIGSSASGILGAVLLLVTWLYFSGLLLLTGAVLNVVLAHRSESSGDRSERQDRSLSRDEAGDYLRLFREQLTGRYQDMETGKLPTDETFLRSLSERPKSIELIEEKEEADDGERYELRIRWTNSGNKN